MTLTFYAFLVQRQQDKAPWPCIYADLDLAVQAYGRVGPVETVELRQNHWPAYPPANPGEKP